MEGEDARETAAAAAVSAALATLPIPVAATNVTTATVTGPQAPSMPTAVSHLISSTVAVPISLAPSTVAIPGVMHIGTPVGASAAVIDPQPDTRRLLTDEVGCG